MTRKRNILCATIVLKNIAYFKTFNKQYFEKYALPDHIPILKNQQKSTLEGTHIKKLINDLILEIIENKRWYTNFDIVKNRDFNEKEHCGMLVLKFKNYPLILKLFFENPKSLTLPLNKGLEPCFFFFMGGGVNRHLTGFTRLRNRELIEQTIKDSPQWRGKVKLPRKWFFIPSSSQWIALEGINIGNKEHQYIEIPGIYAIIADEIKPERVFSLYNKEDRKIALQLSHDSNMIIDANISNFRIEQRTGALTIIDTEHFPSMVGIKERKKFSSYVDFYSYLANKFIFDSMFQTKRQRRMAQKSHNAYHLRYEDELAPNA